MNRRRWRWGVLVGATGMAVVAAYAQPDPHDHSHAGSPVEFKMPKSYAEAVHEIEHRMEIIRELIESKRLDQVHGHADVIRKAAKVAGLLATNRDSGVPKEGLEGVTQASRSLVAYFEKIDVPADGGDAEGTQSAYAEMEALVAKLSEHLPKLYACPMRCEGDQVSKEKGKCSVCGMEYAELRAHGDHKAKHGGTFFMASDQKHHLEGVLTAEREFRVYFYDEYTIPISAQPFVGRATAWSPKAADSGEKPLELTPAAAGEFLTGTIEASLPFPIRVKMFITFATMPKEQVFDFEFLEPSRAETAAPEVPKAG